MKVPLPGEWVPLPGANDDCIVRMAKDPASIVPKIEWEPCAEGGLACERIRFERLSKDGPDSVGFGTPSLGPSVRVDRNGTHLIAWRRTLDGYLRTVHTIGKEGLFAFYFGDAQTCIAEASLGPDGVALVAASAGNEPKTKRQLLVLRSSYEEPLRLTPFDLTSRPGASTFMVGTVGDGFVNLFDGNVVSLVGIDGNNTSTGRVVGSHPQVVRGGVIVEDLEGKAIDFLSVTGQASRRLVVADPDTGVGNVAVDQSNGGAITFYTRSRLLEPPLLYTLSLAPGAPPKRAITHALEVPASRVVNGGRFAYRSKGAVNVVRLADGFSWPPLGGTDPLVFMDVVYVDETSVWVVRQEGNVTSLQRHALVGEPTIPPW